MSSAKGLDWAPFVKRFDDPLRLDIKPFAEVRSAKLPLSVKRLLSRINVNQKPSSKLGFFTANSLEIDDSYRRMNDILTMPKMLANEALSFIERDNAQKVINASGRKAYAYFMSDEYPWIIEGPKDLDLSASALAVASVLERVLDGVGYPSHFRRRVAPSSFGDHPYPIGYKKGSSYGIFPYVPGSSKLSGLALVWHAHTCNVWTKEASANGFSTDLLLDAVNGCSAGRLYTDVPYAVMMIMRARPMSKSKIIPRWRIDKMSGIMTATEGEWGFVAGTREIKAIPAFVNMAFTATAQMFTACFNRVPGLHVGHQILSPSLAALCKIAWAPAKTSFYAEDISGYDNSVGYGLLDSMHLLLEKIWGTSSWDRDYLKFIDSVPIVTCNMLDDERDTNLTLCQRQNGIASGFQGTTLYGTTINLISMVDAISTLKRKTPEQVLRDCANFAGPNGVSLRDTNWGTLLKGDDVLMFFKEGYINIGELQAARLEHGLKTDKEPAPLFLMQYIDTDTIVKGSDYVYYPKKFKEMKTFISHGLMAKRIGNRSIFVEHAINDPRPARLAIAANLSDLPYHPCFQEGRQHFIDILNRHDSRHWSFNSLMTYVASDEAKADMADYASKAGRNDPYIKELIRRRFESQGGISEVDTLDVTNLDDINDIIDDIANVASYGIKELSEQPSDDYQGFDTSSDDEGSWIKFNAKMPTSDASSKLCQKIIKILIPERDEHDYQR